MDRTSYERYRQTNRWVICSSLLIWGAALLVEGFYSFENSGVVNSSLVIAGLSVLLFIVAWPWVKKHLTGDECSGRRYSDQPHQVLVNLEILALSGMLIFLLLHL